MTQCIPFAPLIEAMKSRLMTGLLRATALVAIVTAPATSPTQAQSPAPAGRARDLTFIATSDAHYDAFENEDRNDRVRDTLHAPSTP